MLEFDGSSNQSKWFGIVWNPQLNVSWVDQCENSGSLLRTVPQIYRQATHLLPPPHSPATSLSYFLFKFDDSGSQMDSYWVLCPHAEPLMLRSGGEKLLVMSMERRAAGEHLLCPWMFSFLVNAPKLKNLWNIKVTRLNYCWCVLTCLKSFIFNTNLSGLYSAIDRMSVYKCRE